MFNLLVVEQEKLLATQMKQQRAKKKRKAPTCKTCGLPRRGHKKTACRNQNNNE
jgi:hypothetical protein